MATNQVAHFAVVNLIVGNSCVHFIGSKALIMAEKVNVSFVKPKGVLISINKS